MSGVVGVIAHDAARFSMFGVALSGLRMPAGSRVEWKLGVDIARSCNLLCQELRGEDEWLWLLGDDHAFEADILERLLLVDADIVVPLCLSRWPPFQTTCYAGWGPQGAPSRVCLDPNDHPGGGVVAIHSAGSGGMLIRRIVLEEMAYPWFEMGQRGTGTGEDVFFCDKAREHGFSIAVDLDAAFGHITPIIVWPQRREDGCSFGLGFPEGIVISMPRGMFR